MRETWRFLIGDELIEILGAEVVDEETANAIVMEMGEREVMPVVPDANVIADLKRIILPEEAVAVAGKRRTWFGLPVSLLRKAG